MRHPEAIKQVRRYIADLGGFARPKEQQLPAAEKKAAVSASAGALQPAESTVATSLKAGSLCKIVQIMDMPLELAPGYAIALIKSIDYSEDGDGIVLTTRTEAEQKTEPEIKTQEPAEVQPAARTDAKPQFKPSATWTPIESAGDDGQPVMPTEKHDWRGRTADRDEMLKQAKTDQRYWYSESHGSEKRKKPA